MSAVIEQTFETPAGKYLVDPYEDWARAEGAPVHTGAAFDLLTLETRDWARFGARGAMCHLDGRCDFLTIFLLEVAPGARTAPQRHLYEEICLVLAGHGSTEIETGDGGKRTIEWGPGSLFAAPMNATYRHACASGQPARIACVNDLRYLLNLYRNEKFLFDNPLSFPERGPGEAVRDLAALPVAASEHPNESVAALALAEGSIGADVVELASGVYGEARRQMFGSLAFGVAGEGMTLSFADEDDPRGRVDWRRGTVFAPVGLSFHQHFNIGAGPARFLRVEFGSAVFPILRPRKRAYGDTSVYASGNAVVDHARESPDARRDWLEALRKAGVASRMP